ncbi:hypothetical protein B0J18DRAFT_432498, partial [Chaetomium sp. MPI-SDFR-AT-0129]
DRANVDFTAKLESAILAGRPWAPKQRRFGCGWVILSSRYKAHASSGGGCLSSRGLHRDNKPIMNRMVGPPLFTPGPCPSWAAKVLTLDEKLLMHPEEDDLELHSEE